MSLFEKKVPVFRKRDREAQGRIKEALDAAGIWNRCSHFEQEEIPVGGYSAMDPRNFGKKGRIDREVYVIYVKACDEERAQRAIRDAGLVAEVRTAKELTSEAADKIRDRKY
jgi:hypothetical protein